MDFKDKTAVITGGGSGIGQATAVAAAALNANTVIADIDIEKAEETAALIRENGGNAITVQVDVTSSSDCENLARQTMEEFGSLHYLCNSAGIQTYGTAESTDEETWDKTINVNLKGIFLATKFCIPEIRKSGGGSVVHITSVQGFQTQKNVTAYAASKGGVISMTKTMALDYARENIRINCICPGSINTPMLRYGAAQHGELDRILKEWGENHPIGRVGTAEEVADTVIFLFSDRSSFILGQSIIVDGGLTSGVL